MQTYRVSVAGAAQAVRGTGAVNADAPGAQRPSRVRRFATACLNTACLTTACLNTACLNTACLDRLAGQRDRLPAVAVGGRAWGQHEQPGAWRVGHGDAERAIGVEADQVPPALRYGGQIGEVARDTAIGARCGRVLPRGDEFRGEPRDFGCDRKVGVQRGFLHVSVGCGGNYSSLTPYRSGQRQHEEKQQHGMARWLICGADMRIISPQARGVVKSAGRPRRAGRARTRPGRLRGHRGCPWQPRRRRRGRAARRWRRRRRSG
jgi:hypothetical protein